MNKKYSESKEIIKEKDEEIHRLKKRIAELERKSEQMIKRDDSIKSIVSRESHSGSMQEIKEQDDKHKKHILEINKKIVEDLDALYFFDKVQMKGNSTTPTKVPKLQFNFDNANKEKVVAVF